MKRFKSNSRPQINDGYLINEHIRDLEVRVIDQDGQNLGVISKKEALRLAEEASLDLVQVGEKEGGAITKIMDFGKFLYAKKKQQSEAKKKQKIIQIKEVKLRPNIGDQDYNTKLKHAIEFLKDGKKVKFTLQFRGRQFLMINELGWGLFERIKKDLTAQNLGALVEEKETRGGPFWSKIYYIK